MTRREISMEEIESTVFYKVDINERLNADEIYYWCIAAQEDFDCGCRFMYMNSDSELAPENMGFEVNGISYGEMAQAVSQYTYRIHPDKAVILGGYWISALLVYLFALELVNRLFHIKSPCGGLSCSTWKSGGV